MRYKIFLDGELVNIIIADEAFCIEHYSQNGYSYELEELPIIPTENEPSADEILDILLGGGTDE